MTRVLGAVVLALVLAGCGSRKDSMERFVPKAEAAHAALQFTLEQWMAGAAPGMSSGRSPAINVVDADRAPEQKLEAFQILGEMPNDGPRVFAVKLSLNNPAAEINDRYIVVGIDPIWVFRKRDYDELAHWEMNMDHGAEGGH